MSDLWIRNARLMTPEGVVEGDLLAHDGQIAAVGAAGAPGSARAV